MATVPVVNSEPPASDGDVTPKSSESQGNAPVRSSEEHGHGWDGDGHETETESDPDCEDDDPSSEDRGSGYGRHGGGRDWGGH